MGARVDAGQVDVCAHTIPMVGVGVAEMHIHGSVDKENTESRPKLCKAKTHLFCHESFLKP